MKLLYDINVHGAWFTAREAARHMIAGGGGSIVLVASMSANVRRFRFLAITIEVNSDVKFNSKSDCEHPAGM